MWGHSSLKWNKMITSWILSGDLWNIFLNLNASACSLLGSGSQWSNVAHGSCFFNFCFHFSFFKKTGTLCLHCLLSLGLNRRGWHWRRWWYFQPPKPGRVHQICQKPHGGQGCILCDGWRSKCSYIGTQKHRFVTIYPSNKVTEFDRSDINVIACGVLVHVG